MSWSGKPHFIKACADPEVLKPEAKSMTESERNLSVKLRGTHTQPEARERHSLPPGLALFRERVSN